MPRRFPRPRDIAPLLRIKSPMRQRLAQALTIDDLRLLARKRVPKAVFDFAEGGAGQESSLNRARQSFQDTVWHPRVLRDVSKVDTSTYVLGGQSALPFGIAPTGMTRLLHNAGELAGAAAAGAASIPFCLSTMATTTIEDVAAVNPHGRNWFQLYLWKDRDRSMMLVNRAAEAGFDTLVVTVDVPVGGERLRDQRNGMTIPPAFTPAAIAGILPKLRWWIDLLTTEPMTFASLGAWPGTVAELIDTMFDPAVTFADLAWIRQLWPGKLAVKGIQTVEDACQAADAGVDAVILSTHGGRQLDRAAAPLHLLRPVVREVGADVEVHLDTGIMHGADILAAIAAGATFTYIGRAFLYGLMAGGQAGASRAIAILSGQIERTMRLLGVTSIGEITSEYVSLPDRFGR